MQTNEAEEEARFKQTLTEFLINNGIIRNSDFKFDYNPSQLYQLVCRSGGFNAVTNRKDWGDISREVDGEPEQVKRFYKIYIEPYEKRNYFGQDLHDEEPNIILGAPRKMVKTDKEPQPQKRPEDYTNVLNEITKTLEEEQQTKRQFYLKKNKLNITKAEIKKIILGLDTFMSRKDVVYSLNMLVLYSVNSHHPFLFENHQKIFTALSNYTLAIYPPKNEQDYEDLRTVTLIFRNLTMNPVNLKFMLGTSIFQLFVNMFNIGFDNECSKNIIDIMNGLVKVGWDCNQILKDINTSLLQEKMEDLESAVELLRGLIDERDENLAPAVTQNIQPLLRVIMSNDVNIEIKEEIFEILAFVSDFSSISREELLKNDCLMNMIIGILQQMKNQEKLLQFAALTLSNMASSPSAKAALKKYESELMMIGFSDDSLAGIISNILAELSH